MSNVISRVSILNFCKKPPELRAINALGGAEVYIKHMSTSEKYEWELSVLDEEGKVSKDLLPNSSFTLISKCVLDENHVPFFAATKEVADIDADLAMELREVCQEVNAVKPKAVSEAGKS